MHDKRTNRRNALLFLVLIVSMAVSCAVTIGRLEDESAAVSLPVAYVSGAPQYEEDALDAYRSAEQDDINALRSITENELIDDATREDAARQLQAMILRREKQTALETALSSTALSPCAAIVTEGSVTIVTGKETLTPGESAMVLSLAQAHAGVGPSGVIVLTNGGK